MLGETQELLPATVISVTFYNQCIYESPSFVPSHLQPPLMSVTGTSNLHTRRTMTRMYETEGEGEIYVEKEINWDIEGHKV